MKKIFLILMLFGAISLRAEAQNGTGPFGDIDLKVTVTEGDGSPTLHCSTITASNGTVTDLGGANCGVTTGGGGGAGDITRVGDCTTGDCFTSGGTGSQLFTTTGIMTLGGVGGTQNEDLKLNFESTANEVTVTSSSGVKDLSWSGDLELPYSDSFSGVGTISFGHTTNVVYLDESSNIVIGADHANLNEISSGNWAICIGEGTCRRYEGTGVNPVAVGSFAGYTFDDADHLAAFGEQALTQLVSGHYNTAIGAYSLPKLDAGNSNTCVGTFCFAELNGTQNNNTSFGFAAGEELVSGTGNLFLNPSVDSVDGDGGARGQFTSGNYNTVVGAQAGTGIATGSNKTGSTNVLVGPFTGAGLTTGSSNLLFGFSTGVGLTTGSGNVMFGTSAGRTVTTGSNNVFIGPFAGGTLTTESDQLYIDNSNTTTPLIQGDFSLNSVTFNGTVAITNGATSSGVLSIYEDSDAGTNRTIFTVPSLAADVQYTLPPDDGDAGEQIQTDGNGVLTWEAAGGAASGDVTAVGNCTTADCFTASGGTGSKLFATTGVMTIGATGGSNNEQLGWNYETTANTVAINSTTGVTAITWTGAMTAQEGLTVSDGTDSDQTIFTVNRASTDITMAWDETNDEIDINAPININDGASASGLTLFETTIANTTAANEGAIYVFSDNELYYRNESDGTSVQITSGGSVAGAGAGDITAVGNCTTGSCFGASGSTGSQLFATTGVFTIGSSGGSNNESLGFNFESTANRVSINSTTGVTTIALNNGGLNRVLFDVTGTVTVTGNEATNAAVILAADEADDAADSWSIESAQSDNDLDFKNNSTARFSVSSSGVGTFTSTHTVTSFTFGSLASVDKCATEPATYTPGTMFVTTGYIVGVCNASNLCKKVGVTPLAGCFQ